MRIRGLLLFCLAFLPFVLKAQIESKIDGLVYSDYYYQFKNSINAEKDRNAFQFRRIYFTFENNITQNIKVRFRLESEHASYGSATKINPFVKHAYLEWTNL
ncbi:MAG: OprO/OprP family phosphate-selective porin, partial [candidate division KSB1 bacterium]|nr:OprO/OprP family phosphate-selective porin [candidate division KSB1 bacterium]